MHWFAMVRVPMSTTPMPIQWTVLMKNHLGVSVIAYGTYIRHLTWPVFE